MVSTNPCWALGQDQPEDWYGLCFYAIENKVMLKEFTQLPQIATQQLKTLQFIHGLDVPWFTCVLSFSPLWIFVTIWTIVHQAFLSIGFSRQEYSMPSSRGSSQPRNRTHIGRFNWLMSPTSTGRFFTTSTTGEARHGLHGHLQSDPYPGCLSQALFPLLLWLALSSSPTPSTLWRSSYKLFNVTRIFFLHFQTSSYVLSSSVKLSRDVPWVPV